MSCIFCDLLKNKQDYLFENKYFYAIYDNFPVNKGHVLIISKRHIADYFSLTKAEIKALDEAIRTLKTKLDKTYHPTGYNLGVNNGISAGQTIMHFHLHFIPRYDSDCKNPRGGVRGVIPEKQSY
ncbi:MAG: HIT family protein [Candidatus Izemoplasmatales bacterium]